MSTPNITDDISTVKVCDEVKEHTYTAPAPATPTDPEAIALRNKAIALKQRFEQDTNSADAVASSPPTAEEEGVVSTTPPPCKLSEKVKALPEDERACFWTVETCERYLVACDEKEDKAVAMLRATLNWRLKHLPFQIKFKDVKDVLTNGTVYICGRCKAGRPIFYMSVGTVNAFPAVKRLQLIAYLMEESARRGYSKLTWIFNFARLGENKGTDPEAKKSRKMMMDMCQKHYPERLGALHLINTPWYISLLATLAWPFIDAKTKAKINIKCTPEDLLKYVDKSELVEEFGGEKKRDTSVGFSE